MSHFPSRLRHILRDFLSKCVEVTRRSDSLRLKEPLGWKPLRPRSVWEGPRPAGRWRGGPATHGRPKGPDLEPETWVSFHPAFLALPLPLILFWFTLKN